MTKSQQFRKWFTRKATVTLKIEIEVGDYAVENPFTSRGQYQDLIDEFLERFEQRLVIHWDPSDPYILIREVPKHQLRKAIEGLFK